MLTPRFSLSQDADSVTVRVRTPFAKVSETDVEVIDNELHFYSKPYHLRLYFPGNVLEEGLTSEYHSSEGEFEIRILKKEPGTRFLDLDMLTKLLTPRGSWNIPRISVEALSNSDQTDRNDGSSEESELDWRYPQSLPVETSSSTDDGRNIHHYGFALRRHGVFKDLTEELQMLLDISNVDSLTTEAVKQKREELEQRDFDDEHYLADYFNNHETEELETFSPWWNIQAHKPLSFDVEEIDTLKELPRQLIRIPNDVLPVVWATLAELIYSYAYDCRTTSGLHTVESSWTIAKISPSLSCLDHFFSVQLALRAAIRRSLCYPLHRNWALSQLVLKDVQTIVQLGRIAILKLLLAIRKLFNQSQDNRYILNDLYIIEYCVWIQNVDDQAEDYVKFCQDIREVKIEKDDVNFDLDITEEAGRLAIQEAVGKVVAQDVPVDLIHQMGNLVVSVDSDDE